MTTVNPIEREKLISAMAPQQRRLLKTRASELGLAVQDAAEQAIRSWLDSPGNVVVDVKPDEHRPWGTYLPTGMPGVFKQACGDRGVTYIQGLSQAVSSWLEEKPTPAVPPVPQPVIRIMVCNQKGGVGKTFISGGLAQALAEMGQRVLLVDYDPQGHLTQGLGLPMIDEGEDSLLDYMTGHAKSDIRDLLVTLPQERFGGRLDVLPACIDAYLADAALGPLRVSHNTVERALTPLEDDYDVIVFDGPPSLGLALDAALFYCQRRENEHAQRSGVLIPVNADIHSYNAYKMLRQQIDDLGIDAKADIDYLGLVLNEFDGRRGQAVQRSRDSWLEFIDPGVLVVIKALKEATESAAATTPLLEYAPTSEHAAVMRELAKELAA